jgi:hypothetical protein
MSVQKKTAAMQTSLGFSDLLDAINKSHRIENTTRTLDTSQFRFSSFQSSCVTCKQHEHIPQRAHFQLTLMRTVRVSSGSAGC